jgi:elongation factor Ts
MEISAEQVKKLREKTGVGLMDCKDALRAANGDMEKAVDYLREKGLAKLAKRGGRAATEGSIASYIQGGKIGAMVEVNCEMDFVAKTDEFRFVKDVVMQITASVLCMCGERGQPTCSKRKALRTRYANRAN